MKHRTTQKKHFSPFKNVFKLKQGRAL